ncbi:MAG: DUF177 domain-containing protein [Acidobacteriota bacterium]
MEIRLDQIPDDRLEWREQLSIDASELDHPDLQSLDSIELQGRLERTDDGWYLDARQSYARTLSCVRCLESSTDTVQARIQLSVLVDEDALGEASKESNEHDTEHQLEQSDLGVLELVEPVLDTRPLALEQIQLGIPMKPLCRDDCAGLCPRCGADLNRDACNCLPEVDPRWAALAALRGEH